LAETLKTPPRRRFPLEPAVLAAALLLWAWVCVPTIGGWRTFYMRDVFTTHLPLKAFGAAELREGRIPAFNPTWGLGQPFRGNPNVLAFYPGNLFYLVLPFWSAFNLHYALHWLIAFLTMRALARGLGMGRAGSLMAGLTWAGSGWMLSALTYYNTLTVAAWWPLVMLGAVRGGRRGLALGGLACGLALLGGEPVTAALGLAPLLVAAISRHGWRRGLLLSVGIGAVGVLLALPQVVAFLRVLPFTVRGGQGVTAELAAFYTLHPLRLIEMFLPSPWGWSTHVGKTGVWAVKILPTMPLFFTLYAGIVALWLAGMAVRRHRSWSLLLAAGLLLAIFAGSQAELLVRLSFGLFRFPEKFLLWYGLALPLLAGWGLERALGEGPRRWRRAAAACGGLALVLALGVAAARPALLSAAAARLTALPEQQRGAAAALLETQTLAWTLAFAAMGTALLAAFVVTGPRLRSAAWTPALLLGIHLVTLLQLRPLVVTDSTAPYREPSAWARRLGRGAAVLNTAQIYPPWGKEPPYRVPDGPHATLERITAQDLSPASGVLHGLTYPLVTDLEGMMSPLFAPMLATLSSSGWPERARWLRVVGMDGLVVFDEPGVPELRRLDATERSGVKTWLYTPAAPAPEVWWPQGIVAAPTPMDAVRAVTANPDPIAAVAAPPIAHLPGGRVRLLSAAADRIEIEVESAGGIAVVRRAFQPLLVARSKDRHLPTVPVNLVLLGVVVPPGRHRVTIEASAWPEILAGAVALAAFAVVLGTLWRTRHGIATGPNGELAI
jgi:hypothetical protein